MKEPTVVCVMLTKDRPELAARAVRCFQRQTYENKRLLIVNSGHSGPLTKDEDQSYEPGGIVEPCFIGIDGWTIGALRNHACYYASHHYTEARTRPEIFATWDDDDYSNPNRLTEQVALLQASGADAVGYNQMLFWRTGGAPHQAGEEPDTWDGEQSWLYTNPSPSYALGTSLCYWRKTWERRPFPDLPRPGCATGEDTEWIRGLDVHAASSRMAPWDSPQGPAFQPRMIATIHGGNTSGQYRNLSESKSWTRVPSWDGYCRTTIEAA